MPRRNRTTALLGASVDFLEGLKVWPRCSGEAAALKAMRLVDDTGRLIRAPEVRFSSDEIGLDAFGFNIENRTLIRALEARAAELPSLTRFDDEADIVTPEDEAATIRTAGGQSLSARLVVGADGRHSMCREAAGIEVRRRNLDQAALTFNIAHSRPHQNVSTEFHTPHGPCVFVPLPGDRCSVVWVASPKQAERLAALSDDELADAAEKQSHSRVELRLARCRRYRRPRAKGDGVRRRSRRARDASALRLGPPPRCPEPQLCHRCCKPVAAQ